MPGEDYQSWSVTAVNNGNADTSIEWREGQTRASVNNSSRSEMAAHAKNRNLLSGSIVTGGAPNAQTFTSGVGYTGTVPTGLVVKLKIGASLSNTATSSLNMDGIGDVTIKDTAGNNLKGGELVAGCYTDFLFNGTNWVFLYSQDFLVNLINGGSGVIIGKQVFTTPGASTYTPTPGTESVIIECIGAGGGGGGTPNSAPSNGTGGGGGGAGSYSRAIKTAADIGSSQAVNVGAFGAGGALGGGVGFVGGDSSVGTLCIGKGGGGAAANVGLNSLGGAGGGAGTGDVTGTGQSGEPGLAHIQVLSGVSGSGGSTQFGGGGISIRTATAVHGNNATGYGAGGGGGATYGGFSPTQGGNGSGGIVIITEFAGRGVPGHDGLDGAPGPIGPTGPSGAGTGDVLRFGTPTVGQVAVWTDASHIQGVSPTALTTFSSLVVQTFAASGIYTPTANMKFCIIECIGGGGGGGAGVSAGDTYMVGAGGGSGGYSRKRATAADIGVSQVVTIGAAGEGGQAGTTTPGPNGLVGGDTSVGALCIARAGLGGGYSSNLPPAQNGLGGAGGAPGTGDIVAAGAPGDGGFYNSQNAQIGCRSGLGGSSVMGGGAPGTNAGNGFNATNYGSGGSGGTSSGGLLTNGGNGSAGFVVITEYI